MPVGLDAGKTFQNITEVFRSFLFCHESLRIVCLNGPINLMEYCLLRKAELKCIKNSCRLCPRCWFC